MGLGRVSFYSPSHFGTVPAKKDENKSTPCVCLSFDTNTTTYDIGFAANKEKNEELVGASAQRCVRCTVKANQGFLYPMKSAMLFLHRPIISIKYDKIASIEFRRSSGALSTECFDLEVNYQVCGWIFFPVLVYKSYFMFLTKSTTLSAEVFNRLNIPKYQADSVGSKLFNFKPLTVLNHRGYSHKRSLPYFLCFENNLKSFQSCCEVRQFLSCIVIISKTSSIL
jgi:hypothetical protein